MNDLFDKVRAGKFRAIARLISQIENSPAAALAAVSALHRYTGHAHIIGITGPPGSGKSTLVNELAKQWAAKGVRLAIIAVDPSSPFTGGAILGDRVRMQELAQYDNVFIRSMASRGNLGGLARTTSTAVTVFDAARFELILVETVGAGQAEVEIADAAHTTVVVETPGMGDEVQTIKAGILEIADILVVNKADRPGAARAMKELEMMLHMGKSSRLGGNGQSDSAGEESRAGVEAWHIPVLQTIANEGQGIAELIARIDDHYDYLKASDEWLEREKKRSRKEIEAMLRDRFMARFQLNVPQELREQYVEAIVKRTIDPYTAVDRLVDGFGG